MKTDRACPDCNITFSAVADFCICPGCGRRFYASDPHRQLEMRMPAELTIDAKVAGHQDEDGILNIWFDDEKEGYLQLHRVSDGHEAEFDDRGGVYIEVGSQAVASVNGYASIMLERKRLVIHFRDDDVMKGLVRLTVNFDIGNAFEALADQFAVLMRGKSWTSTDLLRNGRWQ